MNHWGGIRRISARSVILRDFGGNSQQSILSQQNNHSRMLLCSCYTRMVESAVVRRNVDGRILYSSSRWYSSTTSSTTTSSITTKTETSTNNINQRSPFSTVHGRRLSSTTTSSSSPSSVSKLKKIDFEYCVELVQNRDRESYVCGLLLPHESRKAYFAVRAYNVELASIKDGSVNTMASSSNRNTNNNASSATETRSGGSGSTLALKVRMQWWRDAIHQLYDIEKDSDDNHNNHNNSPVGSGGRGGDVVRSQQDILFSQSMAASYYKNPIVRVLKYAIQEKQLTRRFLERLLEARENDLDCDQPDTVEDMVRYADSIFSSLLYLSLETTNVRDVGADVVAQHAGIGLGLVTALRGIRFRLGRGEFPIPKDLIGPNFPYHKLLYDSNNIAAAGGTHINDDDHHPLTEQEYMILQQAVEHIANLASMHLNRAKDLQRDIPKHGRSCCLLPMVPAIHYLSRLEKVEYNILDDTLLEQHHLTILGSLGKVWLTGAL
jgi:NADH dehydrogenase [ubiquinone] 1 alpha subcomplex assembly factor 6